jgi:hypothetical protein
VSDGIKVAVMRELPLPETVAVAEEIVIAEVSLEE